jgi:hypothetical protein
MATNWGSFSLKGRQNPKWTIRGRKKTGYQLSIIHLLSNFVGWSVGSRVSIGLNQTAHQVGG